MCCVKRKHASAYTCTREQNFTIAGRLPNLATLKTRAIAGMQADTASSLSLFRALALSKLHHCTFSRTVVKKGWGGRGGETSGLQFCKWCESRVLGALGRPQNLTGISYRDPKHFIGNFFRSESAAVSASRINIYAFVGNARVARIFSRRDSRAKSDFYSHES